MMKTLIEKMQSRQDIPKAWVAELRAIMNQLEEVEGKAAEYLLIIDRLARSQDMYVVEVDE